MWRSFLAAAGFVVLGSAALAQSAYQVETVTGGLEYPWAVAELPNGDLLVTEQPGRLRLIEDGALRDRPLNGVPDVFYSGQGGLMDLALHPDFAENGLVYLTWSDGNLADNTLKLGRGRLAADGLAEFETIFAADLNRSTNVHYGARLAFLADGSLLLGIGDGWDFREQAQRPASHYGTYVHLADDGTPMPSRFAGAAAGVFSIGHRNPQAVVRDPETGIVYSHEHGPRGGDEVNILVEGANYGWPITSHGVDYTGAVVTPFETYPGMSEPLVYWTPSIAPAGMAVYRGEMFADWDGDLLVTALIPGDAGTVSGHLRRVDLDGREVVGQDILLGELEARLRDVRVASDGALWVLTDEADGRLVRVFR